jgi:hypothetical protein
MSAKLQDRILLLLMSNDPEGMKGEPIRRGLCHGVIGQIPSVQSIVFTLNDMIDDGYLHRVEYSRKYQLSPKGYKRAIHLQNVANGLEKSLEIATGRQPIEREGSYKPTQAVRRAGSDDHKQYASLLTVKRR